MSAIFQMPATDRVRLVNVQTLGACCGTFASHEEAEDELRRRGYSDSDFGREGKTVWFRGGINC